MSGAVYVDAVVCGFAALAVALRLTRWNSAPNSRRTTIALTLLTVGVGLEDPSVRLGDWIDQRIPLSLANISLLLGDLFIAAGAGYVVSVVVHAWGRGDLRRWIIATFAVIAAITIALYVGSDVSKVAQRPVGYLGGMATVYSYFTSVTILVAHLLVLGTIAIAQMPTRDRLALVPMMLAALMGALEAILRIASMISRATFGDLRANAGWMLWILALLLYSISGVIGYFYRPAPARPVSHSR